MPCHSDPAPCPADEVNSSVEAGEVADEVRRKGGASAEGLKTYLCLMFNHERRGENVILRSFVSRARGRFRMTRMISRIIWKTCILKNILLIGCKTLAKREKKA